MDSRSRDAKGWGHDGRSATVERTADPGAAAPPRPDGAPRPLEGVPRQRPRPEAAPADAPTAPPLLVGPGAAAAAQGVRCGDRLRRVLPGPRRTPFTFWYALVLVLTSLVTEYAPASVVDALYRSSSTDVAHLVRDPVRVLAGSALWIAGGVVSAYSLCFLLVLTALELRTGARRTAGVFLLGHVVATLATEVPVGLAVLAGRLPAGSLHRLDYGISFGVAASVGALCGLLRPWLRWPALTVFAGMLLDDLASFTDPMTSCGHLIALAVGVGCWPVLRRGPGLWH